MSGKKKTFVVVHPDGTYQTRTTTRGRVYTGAIVKVESIEGLIERYEERIESADEWYVTFYQEKLTKYRAALAEGQRYLYGKAEYRSDIEAARSEASSRNAKSVAEPGHFDVYLVHEVPAQITKSKHAEFAKQIAAEWAVPF